ncbi:MAG: hypothetical protein QM808_17690 [Steroidobacteraceae bacterium]
MNDIVKPEDTHPSSALYVGMPVLQIEKYKSQLEGLDLTDAQQEEFLKTLWSIMASFVRVGWGVEHVPNLFPDFNNASLSAETMPEDELTTLASDFNSNVTGPFDKEILEP